MTDGRDPRDVLPESLRRVLAVRWDYLDVLVAAILLAYFAVSLVVATGYGFRARLFPTAVAVPAIVVLATLIALRLARIRGGTFRDAAERVEAVAFRAKSLYVLGWIAGLVVLLFALGFELGTLVFAFAFYYGFGGIPLGRSVLYTLIVWGSTVVLFIFILRMPTPDGALVSLPLRSMF